MREIRYIDFDDLPELAWFQLDMRYDKTSDEIVCVISFSEPDSQCPGYRIKGKNIGGIDQTLCHSILTSFFERIKFPKTKRYRNEKLIKSREYWNRIATMMANRCSNAHTGTSLIDKSECKFISDDPRLNEDFKRFMDKLDLSKPE